MKKMNTLINKFIRFQNTYVQRMIWPYTETGNSLIKWRGLILFSILLGALILGLFAFFATIMLIVKESAWGLAVVDTFAVIVCLIFLFVHHIKFEIRASLTCLAFYVIGISVIISMGPLSGGPAWLFTFAVLTAVLMGNVAAFLAIFLNAVSIILIAYFIRSGHLGHGLQFFNSTQATLAAGVNFIVLNAIAALSVSALLKVLYESEKRYRMIADNVADVIWTADMDLNITYISPSVYQMHGFSTEEAFKMSMADFAVPESLEKNLKVYEEKLKQIGTGDKRAWEPIIFETEQYRKNGSTFQTSIHARMLKGNSNQPLGILGITRDISDRKRSEQEKINAQIIAQENKKLALVGRVAGKMAHDFNNILGVIMGNSELALLDCSNEHTEKALKNIMQQTVRGRNITRNLVAFAKEQEPKIEAFPVRERMDFVLILLANDLKGVKIVKEYDPDHIMLLADPGMIEHSFVNIIQNSIHAVSLCDDPEIHIRTGVRENLIFIEISDNGCGIPKEYLENIFEPSFTLKGSKDLARSYKPGIKGSGYGMANVKKYIELHKGDVTVESKIDGGTVVLIELPLMETKLTKTDHKKVQTLKQFSKKHILLVEDEKEIRNIQCRILTYKPCYHKVDTAVNGKDALDLFGQNNYDFISLDYVLEGELNGIDVYQEIRKSDNKVPILFISGNLEFIESIGELKKRDGFIDHLSKPCTNEEYIKNVNTLLGKRQ